MSNTSVVALHNRTVVGDGVIAHPVAISLLTNWIGGTHAFPMPDTAVG